MSKFRKLMEKYSSATLVDGWFKERSGDRRLPNVDQVTDIFYKAARDFKAGELSLKDFSDVCGELLFGAYLQYAPTRKKQSYHLLLTVKPNPSLNSESSKRKLDPKIEKALFAFSDPYGEEVDKHWRLKKEFHEKYLGFVK